MFDDLVAMTALPNLHPALVHFPIALSVVALLVEVVVWSRWYSAPVDWSAAALWFLAAAGAGAAYAAGREAADGLGELTPATEATLASHADAALLTVSALAVLALLRVWLARRDGAAARGRRDVLRITALLGALIVQGLVAYTADLGGALVFRYGVAVSERPAPTTPAAPTATPTTAARSKSEPEASSRFSHLEDGSMVWKPNSGDAAALGEILKPVGEAAVRIAEVPSGAEGLSLLVSGRTLLLFPEVPNTSEDVQLEAQVDLSAFDGTIGLGARVEGNSSGGFVRVRSDGATKLVARRASDEEILDEAHSSLIGGKRTLGLSAVGRHWKGFVDGVTVVHGHSSLPASGRTALLLDGAGTVQLISIRISPLHAEDAHE